MHIIKNEYIIFCFAMVGKRLLPDVIVIRPLFIAIVVVYHAFIIYMGGWKEPIGFVPVKVYDWLASFLYSVRMQGFVFMAGYVYAYQVLTLGKNDSLKQIVTKKFKRLILPSVFFSVIYFLMFYDWKDYNVLSAAMSILSGCGHMWFLPMLFWCFWGGKMLIISNINRLLIFIILAVISLLPWSIPLGIGNALHYMVYFWGGFLVWQYHDKVIQIFCTKKNMMLSCVLFVIFYLFSAWFRQMEFLGGSEGLFYKGIRYVTNSAISLIVTMFGIWFVYLLVNYFVEKRKYMPPYWVFEASAICYGVYIFQQFILQFLYYKTSLPVLVGPYWLPWVGCVVTFVVSILLTKLTLKTRFGRFLIG